jgi:acetoin utilization deacetylase AcuC-like enzyme
VHGAKNFPFRKVASDLDVDLPDGCTDGPYLAAVDAALDRFWLDHRDQPPGLVFYQAGADPHEGDRLGRLKVSAAGLAERDRRVFAACRSRGIPVVLTMGGGYGHVIEETVAVQLQTYREALAAWQASQPGNPGKPEVPAMLHRGNNVAHDTNTPN